MNCASSSYVHAAWKLQVYAVADDVGPPRVLPPRDESGVRRLPAVPPCTPKRTDFGTASQPEVTSTGWALELTRWRGGRCS